MYSVVIPTYRRPKELLNCVEIILRQTIKPKEIVVSGVESDDELKGVLDILKEKCQREGVDFKCILSSTRGIAYQRNRGLENASCEYILMIDDDVEIPPDFVETGLSIIKDRNLLIVSGVDLRPSKVKPFQNFLRRIFFLSFYSRDLQKVLPSGSSVHAHAIEKDIFPEWLVTTVLILKKDVIEKVKFDENLVSYSYREDQDFTYRVYKVFGRKLLLTPKLKFYHNHSPRGRVKESVFCHLYIYNTYLFFRKHFFEEKYKALFVWSMIGMALQALNHSLQRKNLGIFYESVRALIRLVSCWNSGRNNRYDKLYKPVS